MKVKVFMGLASLTAGTRSDFLGKVLCVVVEKRHPENILGLTGGFIAS